MTISVEQLRAGRALLGWNQERVAQAAGVSLKTLSNIERGAVAPRVATMTFLQEVLEDGGIEFTDASGVRLRREVLDILKFEGPDCLVEMHEDILRTLKDGEELLCFNFN